MAFDGIVIANLADEINKKAAGGRISKISQPESDEIILTVKSQKDTYKLLLSANPSLPLVYFTDKNFLNPMTAPNFCMLLRKYIGNARIISADTPGLERILRIHLEHLDEMGDLRRKVLITEIMGKYSNIIFCSEDGTILDSIRHVSAAVSSVREVLPGRKYFIPDTVHKMNPLEASFETFKNCFCAGSDPASAISKNYTGISNASSTEIVCRSIKEPVISASECTQNQINTIYETFTGVMSDIKSGCFSPCIAYKNDEPVEFSSILLTGHTDCEVRKFSSISEVISSYYSVKSQLTKMKQKSSDLRHLVNTLTERTAKKYDLQCRQLSDTDKKDKFRIYGEMLNTYGYNIPKDAKSTEVINYYTGENLTIPLDPTLTASENAQKYFEKYNKLKRTSEALTELTKETKNELDQLESILTYIDIAQNDADLDEIKKELAQSGYIKSQSGAKARKDTRRKCQPYHYVSSDGFDIYVGKNNLQNEELTFKLAQGNDIWMHAKKVPGSHVIIQSKGRDIPDRTYEEAGSLAVYYSRSRTSPKAEVDYIEKKHVKKPAGAKPGFVIYHTNYSLVASPDIKGIRLLNED